VSGKYYPYRQRELCFFHSDNRLIGVVRIVPLESWKWQGREAVMVTKNGALFVLHAIKKCLS